MRVTDQYTFFYGSSECFSQWYASSFEDDRNTYATAEHYMMYKKAELFGATDTMRKILAAGHPRLVKDLGRHGIANFDAAVWNASARQIVGQGNYLKFSQNAGIRKELLSTAPTLLVEASPVDPIWGIGLSENHSTVTDSLTWRGTNWLGLVLTAVRDQIIEENSQTTALKSTT